ncbi:MAG: hypothetical protein ACPGVY_04880 [Mycobacterium sp.]
MNQRSTHCDRPAAREVRGEILRSRNTFWKPSDLKLPPSTAQRLLAELVANEDLRHIRKGLYWRGIKTPLGMASPSPATLAARLAGGRGIGPSGLSAANALRLSTQIPRRADYAVVDRPPANGDVVRFVARSSRRGRAVHDLGPLDIAALEVLDSWDRLIEVGPNEAMGHLTCLIQSGTLNAKRLALASGTEPGSSRARLRYLPCSAGRQDLADAVPPPDPRTESKALTGLTIA